MSNNHSTVVELLDYVPELKRLTLDIGVMIGLTCSRSKEKSS